MKNKPWKSAIIEVLRMEGEAMSRTDIAERIVEKGLRQDVGSTPANTVVSYISTSMSKDGIKSPFVRVGRGEYALREIVEAPSERMGRSEKELVEKQAAINAFGMFWLRELVQWGRNPKLLGQQQLGANNVDMTKQIGIYLLYDGRDIIYVGRSVDRPLGQRLFEHTRDRLRARWDRFSWFGLYEVSEKGKLIANLSSIETDQIIKTMEAVLIESLEPPQNRKRGDDFQGIEFIQSEDPEIQRARDMAAINRLQSSMDKR